MAELTSTISYDPDRPFNIGSSIRQHSRSSSQVATLASLTLAAASLSSLPPSPTRSQNGNQSPRYSISGLTGGNGGNLSTGAGGGRESPVYISRSNTPEPPWVNSHSNANYGVGSVSMTGIESRAGRLSLDGTSSSHSNNLGGASIRNTISSSSSSRLSNSSTTRSNYPEELSISNSNSSTSESFAFPSSSNSQSNQSPPSSSHQPLPLVLETNPTNLAQLIQQKRRQASAPYFASAKSSSLFSPGAGFGITSITDTNMASERIDFAGAWGAGGGVNVGEGSRRARSRQATRVGSLVMTTSDDLINGGVGGGMVMTPTTAEWKSLGGQLSELADIRARDEAKIDAGLPIDGSNLRSPTLSQKELPSQTKSGHSSGANSISTNSSSSSISLTELNNSTSNSMHQSPELTTIPLSPIRPSPRPISIINSSYDLYRIRSNSDPTTPLPPQASSESKFKSTSFSYQTSHTGFTHSSSLSFDSKPSTSSSYTSPSSFTSSPSFIPTHRLLSSSDSTTMRPNLSSGSLSTTTGSLIPNPFKFGTGSNFPSSHLSTSSSTPFDSPPLENIESLESELIQPIIPVSLAWTTNMGPVDPRRYSAFTGMRSINDFVILEEAGKGAYGTVCKAREKGVDGLGIGPELVIKYIIKQRILADCWKKHKILGPIPIEVHVLDHLRRVSFIPRLPGRRSSGNGKNLIGGAGIGRRTSGGGALNLSTNSKDGNGMGSTMTTGHPNICGMLDFFEDGEFYYLVMPQAGTDPDSPLAPRGQDLFEHVDANADGLPPSSMKRILSQIADAISFLHQHGIVHRDIKDENVVLDHLGNARLIDFGSAAYVKEGKRFDTFSGTLDFAAPEVLRGCRYGGKETDVWAIGVLAYVITIGECPFWSPEEAMIGLAPGSRAEQALRSKCSSSTPIFSLSPSSPISSESSSDDINDSTEGSGRIEDAVDLVMRCLEVDPDDRPTAELILEHRFICGKEGWIGARGWEDDVMDVEVE